MESSETGYPGWKLAGPEQDYPVFRRVILWNSAKLVGPEPESPTTGYPGCNSMKYGKIGRTGTGKSSNRISGVKFYEIRYKFAGTEQVLQPEIRFILTDNTRLSTIQNQRKVVFPPESPIWPKGFVWAKREEIIPYQKTSSFPTNHHIKQNKLTNLTNNSLLRKNIIIIKLKLNFIFSQCLNFAIVWNT